MWEFLLKFRLPDDSPSPEDWLDALFAAGCDDATAGLGRRGVVALNFTRAAPSAEDAVRSAMDAVAGAIPGAVLLEVGPDLVNLADLAAMVGCTRQNLRKYAVGEIRTLAQPFPEPVHTGSPSLWRLAEVLPWLERNTSLRPDPALAAVARVASALNLEVQGRRLRAALAAE